jgi:hypothetical protein
MRRNQDLHNCICKKFNEGNTILNIAIEFNVSELAVKRILTANNLQWKIISYCSVCNTKILDYTIKLYCSRECYYKSRIGLKWPERGMKTSKTLKGHSTIERGPAISEALIKRYKNLNGEFTQNELLLIEKYFIEGYTLNFKSIMKHEFPEKNSNLLSHYIKNNLDWFHKFNVKKCNPSIVQKWSLQEWLDFKEDCKNNHYMHISKKYNLHHGSVVSLCKRNNISVLGTLDKDKKMTSIERILFDWLSENKINFKREQNLNKYLKNGKIRYKYRIDFFINNSICLEVHGDYWHVNPRLFFDFSNLSLKQKKNIINDIEKKNWCIKNNYRFYTIWEMDLVNNLHKTLNNFKDFISLNLIEGDSKDE